METERGKGSRIKRRRNEVAREGSWWPLVSTICFDWRTFPTSSPRFSFGVLSAVRIARARAHPCLSCDVYRLVGDNHRRGRALTEPITSIEAATVRLIIAIYFLVYLLSLFLGFPFLRSVALDSGYILCFSWVLVQAAVSCGREGIALKSLDSLSWSKAGITTQTTRKVRNTP